jgi:hypothetical protein
MNFWKPVALASIAVSVLSVGYNVASASPGQTTVPSVAGGQPHMESALALLKQAKGELQSAEHDKGGWRANAVGGVTTAINETQRGIAAGAGK